MEQNPLPSIPAATPQQTKAQILEAYQKLLEQYKQNLQQASVKQTQQKKTEEEKVVAKTADYTPEKITGYLEEAKRQLNDGLEQIGRQLQGEVQKLTEIREAAAIEKRNIEEFHKITVEIDTLANILRAQEEAKREWERERLAYEHQRDIERKKEEMEYQMKIVERSRRFEEEIKTKEKILEEREKTLKTQEVELLELRRKAEIFPKDLEKTVTQEREKVIQEEKEKAAASATLLAARQDGEKRLQELKIAGLEKQAVELKQEIVRLSKQLEEAIQKNQELAAKLIEGVAGFKTFKLMEEKEKRVEKEEK